METSSILASCTQFSGPGDQVVVASHTIRADRREQAEQFLEMFAHALRQQKADPGSILYPAGPNHDGTFTYGFISEKADRAKQYLMIDVLKATMSETEARQTLKMYEDSIIDQTVMAYVVKFGN